MCAARSSLARSGIVGLLVAGLVMVAGPALRASAQSDAAPGAATVAVRPSAQAVEVDPAGDGATVGWSVEVVNTGAATLTDLELVILLEDGLAFVSADSPLGSFRVARTGATASGPRDTTPVGTIADELEPGGSYVVAVTALVSASLGNDVVLTTNVILAAAELEEPARAQARVRAALTRGAGTAERSDRLAIDLGALPTAEEFATQQATAGDPSGDGDEQGAPGLDGASAAPSTVAFSESTGSGRGRLWPNATGHLIGVFLIAGLMAGLFVPRYLRMREDAA